MFFSPATKNGQRILKKCTAFFITHPITLLFPLLIVISNSAIFLSILAIEEHYYGVSLFKPKTFYNWLSFDISHHLLKCCTLLLIVFVAAFINNICNTALTFYFLKKLDKQKQSLLSVLRWLLFKIPFISYIAVILVIDYIVTLFNTILTPQSSFTKILTVLQGKKLSQNNILNTEEGMIFLPLTVSNNKSVPENLAQSTTLMEQTFGTHFSWNVSFLEVKFLVILFIGSTIGFFIHYHYNLLPAIIFSFFLIMMIFLLIDTAVLFFKACLFNYIKNKSTGNFTRKEINSYFTKTT